MNEVQDLGNLGVFLSAEALRDLLSVIEGPSSQLAEPYNWTRLEYIW